MHRKSILVLGMHRSGTSALARILSLLGCDLPHTLMPKAISNPNGHWESSAIMALNDAVLESAGSSWDDWLEFNPAWYVSPVADGFLQRASTVLTDEFGTSPLFVLKDPRICRLTRFWLNVLSRADVDPLVVIPLRSPLEVAASLEERDGISAELAILLWLRNVLDAEHGSRGCRRVFLAYEGLLDDWVGVAERMQNALAITWPRFSIFTALDVEAFLDPDSRHHVQPVLGSRSSLMFSEWVRDTDAILRRWLASGENSDEFAALDTIRQQLNAAGPAFAKLTHAISSERHQSLELRGLLQAGEEELAQLQDEISVLRDAQGLVEKHSGQSLAASEARMGELEGNRFALEAEKTALADELAGLREHVYRVEAELQTVSADRDAGSRALNTAWQNIEQLRREMLDHQHELGNVQSTLRQREEEIAQTLSSLHDECQKANQAEEERVAAEERLEIMNDKLEDADRWVFRLAGDRRAGERREALAENRLAAAQQALTRTSAQLADVRGQHHLDQMEKTSLRGQIGELTATIKDLNVQSEDERQRWNAAQSEVVLLSKLLKQRENSEEQVTFAQSRLAEAQQALTHTSAQLTDVRGQHDLDEKEKTSLLGEINELTALVKNLGVQGDEGRQRWNAAQSEITLLSKLLKQQEAELASVTSPVEVEYLSKMLKTKEEAADQSARHADWLQKVSAVVTGYPHWWAFVPRRLREKWKYGRLLRRKLFDSEAYLARYPDVSSSGLDPLRHYIIHGIGEERSL